MNISQLALLPDELRIDRIPPLAMRCVLTGLRCEPNSACYRNAGHFLGSYAFPQGGSIKMKMKIHHDDLFSKTWHVDLLSGDESVNQLLAKEGFVLQGRDYDLPYCFKNRSEYGKEWEPAHCKVVDQYFADIKQSIAEAKAAHKNLFIYGDIEEDGDEDNLR